MKKLILTDDTEGMASLGLPRFFLYRTVKAPDGWFKLYGDNVDGRGDQYICDMTESDHDRLRRFLKPRQDLRVAKEKRENEAKAERDAWIESLPDQVSDDLFICKLQKAFTDKFGNYLEPLPAAPIDTNELEKWFDDHFHGSHFECSS